MRTWKQGAVGKVSLKEGKNIFLKCLKYPLAIFYRNYDISSKEFDGELFFAYLDLSALTHIARIDELKLSLTEKKISISFSFDFETSKIYKNQGSEFCFPQEVYPNKLMEIGDIESLIASMGK